MAIPTPLITLTGTVVDDKGNLLSGGTATVTLQGYGSSIPKVNGIVILGSSTLSATVVGGSFTIGPFYGNDVIQPGPNVTWYTVTVPAPSGSGGTGGTITQQFRFSGSGTFDIANLSPLNSTVTSGSTTATSVIPQVFSPQANKFLTGLNSLGQFSAGSVTGRSLTIHIDGAGFVPTTGIKAHWSATVNFTITGWVLIADRVGSVVIDVLRSTYAAFPTTASIAGTDKPTLSAVQKNENLGPLANWVSTSILAGDVLEFNINSISTCTFLDLTLNVVIS